MHKKLVVETNNKSGKDYIKICKVQSVMKQMNRTSGKGAV